MTRLENMVFAFEKSWATYILRLSEYLTWIRQQLMERRTESVLETYANCIVKLIVTMIVCKMVYQHAYLTNIQSVLALTIAQVDLWVVWVSILVLIFGGKQSSSSHIWEAGSSVLVWFIFIIVSLLLEIEVAYSSMFLLSYALAKVDIDWLALITEKISSFLRIEESESNSEQTHWGQSNKQIEYVQNVKVRKKLKSVLIDYIGT